MYHVCPYLHHDDQVNILPVASRSAGEQWIPWQPLVTRLVADASTADSHKCKVSEPGPSSSYALKNNPWHARTQCAAQMLHEPWKLAQFVDGPMLWVAEASTTSPPQSSESLGQGTCVSAATRNGPMRRVPHPNISTSDMSSPLHAPVVTKRRPHASATASLKNQ